MTSTSWVGKCFVTGGGSGIKLSPAPELLLLFDVPLRTFHLERSRNGGADVGEVLNANVDAVEWVLLL
jgi:hypothetical protein